MLASSRQSGHLASLKDGSGQRRSPLSSVNLLFAKYPAGPSSLGWTSSLLGTDSFFGVPPSLGVDDSVPTLPPPPIPTGALNSLVRSSVLESSNFSSFGSLFPSNILNSLERLSAGGTRLLSFDFDLAPSSTKPVSALGSLFAKTDEPLQISKTCKKQSKKQDTSSLPTAVFDENGKKMDDLGLKDIIDGQGSGNYEHPGNKTQRKIINKNVKDYCNIDQHKRNSKVEFSLKIVKLLQQRYNARFLQRQGDHWVILSEAKARRRIASALRERRRTLKKQAKRKGSAAH